MNTVVTVRVVEPELTRELRRSVLRPQLSQDDPLPGDDVPDAVHLAALDGDGDPLCTCIVFDQECPWRPGETAWQLRQMATAEHARGQGHGRDVVAAALDLARERGAAVLWCEARESAAGFYERCGWHRHGEVFTDDHHPGPHVRMWIEIPAERSPSTAHPFGFVGAVALIAGLLPTLIGLTSSVWFTGIPVTIGGKLYLAPVSRRFDQVSTLLDGATSSSGLATAYFGWLAWSLLGVTFVCALVAITPNRLQAVFRITTPVIVAVAILLTTLSLQLVGGGDFSFWWRLRGTGYWLAVAGFAVMGAGAALGPVGARRLHSALTGGAR